MTEVAPPPPEVVGTIPETVAPPDFRLVFVLVLFILEETLSATLRSRASLSTTLFRPSGTAAAMEELGLRGVLEAIGIGSGGVEMTSLDPEALFVFRSCDLKRVNELVFKLRGYRFRPFYFKLYRVGLVV